MLRPWIVGLIAGAVAVVLFRSRSPRVIPVGLAAEQLRQAWADHHTVG
jgi:hypothetical protein